MATFMTYLQLGRSLLPVGYIKNLISTKTPRIKQRIRNEITVPRERDRRCSLPGLPVASDSVRRDRCVTSSTDDAKSVTPSSSSRSLTLGIL